MVYIVALQVGGLMEMPEMKYHKAEPIEADSEYDAEQIYNKKNNCEYFYGKVVGQVDEDTVRLSETMVRHFFKEMGFDGES